MCLYLDNLPPCHCQPVHKEEKRQEGNRWDKQSNSVLCFPRCLIPGQRFLGLFILNDCWKKFLHFMYLFTILLVYFELKLLVFLEWIYIVSLSKYVFCFHSLLMACMKKEWLKMFIVAPWRVWDLLILEWVHLRVQWTSIAKVYPYCACSMILGPLVPQRVCSSL